MKSHIVKFYTHSYSEDADFNDFPPGFFKDEDHSGRFARTGYEIEYELEVFEDGSNRVVSINGVKISENVSI